MTQIRFYAVGDDLIHVLKEIELETRLQYVKVGTSQSLTLETHQSVASIPSFGHATADSAINSDSFLVAERDVPIRSRSIRLHGGGINFCVDQLENPDTAIFTPAGKWEDLAVLYGTFGTASATEASINLTRVFERSIKRHFKKMKAYWVGPEAHEWLTKGGRLTIAIQSPKEFDLSPS